MDLSITLVAAMTSARVIGRAGALPWHIPTDLQHFRQLTLGKPLIMGRRTFEAIGRVLPGRTSIVLTGRPLGIAHPDLVPASSLDEAVSRASDVAVRSGATEINVAGGGVVFSALLPHADELALTIVDCATTGDTYFPAIDPTEWIEAGRARPRRAPQDDAAVTFVTLRRRRAGASRCEGGGRLI